MKKQNNNRKIVSNSILLLAIAAVFGVAAFMVHRQPDLRENTVFFDGWSPEGEEKVINEPGRCSVMVDEEFNIWEAYYCDYDEGIGDYAPVTDPQKIATGLNSSAAMRTHYTNIYIAKMFTILCTALSISSFIAAVVYFIHNKK